MRVLVVANGEMVNGQHIERYAAWAELIVCADGGSRHVHGAGLRPHLVVGDLDSISPALHAEWQDADVEFFQFPPDKDETDLELALLEAVKRGADQIVILGALGRRVDHELGNLLLLAHPSLAQIDVRIVVGQQEIVLVRDRAEWNGRPGDLLSLLPIGGDAYGVVSRGLEYPLCDEVLRFGPARGVSNVFTVSKPSVCLKEGLLLAVHTRRVEER